MRLHALTLALAVLYARAATIPLDVEQTKPADDQHQNNVGSDLRNDPDVIPVAIVEDVNPTPKRTLDENSNDYVPNGDEPSFNVKRLEIDLNNPGPPQRQEHETQNPEFYAERDYFVSDIKQKLLDTENIFKKSVADVNEGFVNWVPNSEHLKVIRKDLKDMQNKFLTQLSNLNKSLQSYLNPQSTKSVIVDPQSTANLKEVENRLKVLEVNFKAGVQTLSEGVKALETAKADGEGPATAEKPSETGSPSPPPSPPPPNEQSPSNNPLGQLFQFFSNAMGDAINNVQNAFQSFTNPSSQNSDGGAPTSSGTQAPWNPIQGIFNPSTSAPPAGAQSDETTQSPSWWNNFQTQLNQIFFPSQGNQQDQASQGTPTNAFLQVFQNNPFQGLINQFSQQTKPGAQSTGETKPQNDQPTQPLSTPSKPVQPQSVQPQSAQQPQIVQPQPVQPQVVAVQPEAQPQPQAAVPPKETAATQTGPIRQIVQNNPIVKGIVQRVQSITNPEKPRESINEKAPVPSTKGHGGGGFNNVNGGSTTGDVNNDSDGIVVKSVPIEEKIEEVPDKLQKEKEVEEASDKEEKQTVLPDKTE